jgi:hypothetical protein
MPKPDGYKSMLKAQAQGAIYQLRQIMARSRGGGYRDDRLEAQISALLFQLQTAGLPRRGHGEIPILRNHLSVYFSPRKHKSVRGGLSQVHSDILHCLDEIQWTSEWEDLAKTQRKSPRKSSSAAKPRRKTAPSPKTPARSKPTRA